MVNFQIVAEDEHLMAINKPAGVVVNQSLTAKDSTIQSWLVDYLGGEKGIEKIANDQKNWQELVPSDYLDNYGTPQEIFLQRQGVVHRLDKETSGILLLAKNPGSLASLLAQFRQRQVKKKYLCLIHGKPRVESGEICAPIARSRTNRHKFRVEIEGRMAMTHYRMIRHYPSAAVQHLFECDAGLVQQFNSSKQKKDLQSYQQGFSLLECMPETGRTHQIRVHLAHIGHPLVADGTYGGEKRGKLDKIWCPRHFLHAVSISFQHPATSKKMVLKAQLSVQLQRIIDLFEEKI